MRKMQTFFKSAILAVTVLAFNACSDDDNDGGGGGGGGLPSGTYVKGKVDGTTFETYRIQGISAATAISTGSGDGRMIMIGGSIDQAGTKAWSVNLIGINATGEYPLNADSNSTVAYVENGSGVSYDNSNCSGTDGVVKITKINDTEVEGTFNLVGKNDDDCSMSKTISQGSFRGVFMN